MGSGCSKGGGAAADRVGDGAIADGGLVDGAERGWRWRRSRTQGLACICFFSSNASDKHDKEIKQERHERNASKCMKFMLPCQGRIISSPSSDYDDDDYKSESSSDSDRSNNVPTQAAAITQISEESLIRSASRFSFIPGRVVGSSSDPSADGFHNHGECNSLHQFENLERRPSRRNGFQDPFEGSVRFSRTLSVGRLRDRVLRRSSFSDGPHDTSNLAGRRTLNSNNSDDDHQSILLERRRRLRSQVWALQRLGNRVERSSNAVDEANPRSSISRIVMLAEALFEVLDEIHQQAVVLASRPSISSIGSFPAPKEVVEEMPLRVYNKEEASQCYICLLEYEEGDHVRVLPCGHEFHQSCVDKWLKEIHRVCPLCRGDVCISEVAQPEKPDHSL